MATQTQNQSSSAAPTVTLNNPATTTNTTNSINNNADHALDTDANSQILAHLANLQSLHTQLQSLRHILPNNLLGPARAALLSNPTNNHAHTHSQSQPHRRTLSPPRSGKHSQALTRSTAPTATPSASTSSPAVIAAKISKAATKGHEDIQRFKKQWNDESVRKLFAEVNGKAVEIEQGSDLWESDYAAVSKQRTSNRKTRGTYADEGDATHDGTLDSLDDAMSVVKEMEGSETLKVEKSDDNGLLLIVTVAGIQLQIKREDEDKQYHLNLSESKHSKLDVMVLKALQKAGPWRRLDLLKGMLEAYGDLKNPQTVCSKCKRHLSKNDWIVPTIRKRVDDSTDDDKGGQWVALHETCMDRAK